VIYHNNILNNANTISTFSNVDIRNIPYIYASIDSIICNTANTQMRYTLCHAHADSDEKNKNDIDSDIINHPVKFGIVFRVYIV
jgi:hypothetical protein